MQKISTMLWFDTQAEDAANFYVSIFKNSKITQVSRYGEGMPMPAGSVMVAGFELDGQTFSALNGGPHFTFNQAVSFVIHCDDQEEVDHYWSRLTEGGKEIQCGWLTDKFGLSWQVVPKVFFELISDPDQEKVGRVMHAMMGMVKMDVEGLKKAYEG